MNIIEMSISVTAYLKYSLIDQGLTIFGILNGSFWVSSVVYYVSTINEVCISLEKTSEFETQPFYIGCYKISMSITSATVLAQAQLFRLTYR